LYLCYIFIDLKNITDLRPWEIVVKRVAVVKLGANNGSGDGYKQELGYLVHFFRLLAV